MSSIAAERTRALARLAVSLGANVAPGQEVVVLAYDVDPARAGRDIMPLTGAMHTMHGGGEVNWTFVPAPSSGAAERILGTADVDALWDVLTPILRLDADDPEEAWRRHMDDLSARADALNERSFVTLRFHGPGTDLKVGLMGAAHWLCPLVATSWGRSMIANMPTEEVFTTPDNRIAEGTVTATRPIPLLGGATVEGLRLRFEHGRVVEVDADRNADALRSRIETDDGTSPVGRSGRVFNDILFDENATCHIALGNGYPFTVPDLPGDAAGRRGTRVQRVRHPSGHDDWRSRDRHRRARCRRQRDADPPRRRLGRVSRRRRGGSTRGR